MPHAQGHGRQLLRARDAGGRAAHRSPARGAPGRPRRAGARAASPAARPPRRGAHHARRVASSRRRPRAPALVIRPATPCDNAAIAAIWNREVLETAATTDTEPRGAEAQQAWLAADGPAHPVIVAVDGGEVVAFGALAPYRAKPSYAHTVEDSVYVTDGWRG